jgi:uncharacterized protein
MPQYLYQIFPTRATMLTEGLTDEESSAMSQHFTYLMRLLAEGKLILAGRTQHSDPSSFGVVIYNAENDEQAHDIMNNDPSIILGVTRGYCYPYRVALISQANADEK